MRIVFYFICLCIFLTTTHPLYAREIVAGDELYQEITVETLHPYFNALKNGDVGVLKILLAGKIYRQYEGLLEKNKGYPAFLRNYYQDANFLVDKIETNGDDILVDIIIQFPGNRSLQPKFLLRKEEGNLSSGQTGPVWKLIEQVNW